MSEKLSQEAEYQRFDHPKGILRWDLNVAPGTGLKATSIDYSYTLEFDKSLSVGEISNERKSRLRTDFLQKSKRSSVRGKSTFVESTLTPGVFVGHLLPNQVSVAEGEEAINGCKLSAD